MLLVTSTKPSPFAHKNDFQSQHKQGYFHWNVLRLLNNYDQVKDSQIKPLNSLIESKNSLIDGIKKAG
jgi:DUF971 family protein